MQKKSKILIAFLGGIGSLLAVFVLVMHNQSGNINSTAGTTSVVAKQKDSSLSESHSETEQNTELLKQRITSIESSLNKINTQLSNLSNALEREAIIDNHDAPSRPDKIELTQEEIVQLQQERIQRLEDLVNPGISYDPEWSTYTEENVRNAFSENGGLALAKNSSVQCGATACKVSATLPKSMPSSQRDIYQLAMILGLGQDLPHASGGGSQQQSDGSHVVTVYMGRKNHPLPRLTGD